LGLAEGVKLSQYGEPKIEFQLIVRIFNVWCTSNV